MVDHVIQIAGMVMVCSLAGIVAVGAIWTISSILRAMKDGF